jgi:hypothetical protein
MVEQNSSKNVINMQQLNLLNLFLKIINNSWAKHKAKGNHYTGRAMSVVLYVIKLMFIHIKFSFDFLGLDHVDF